MPEDKPHLPPAEQPPEPQSTPTSEPAMPPPPEPASFGTQMFLGFGAFLLLLIGVPASLAIIGMRSPGSGAGLIIALISTGLGLWLLMSRIGRGRGLWIGFLTGLGLVALVLGICAITVW